MGKEIALVLVQWVLHDPSLELVPPLEMEPPLEVEPTLEVEAGDGLGKKKRVQGGIKMGPGPGLGETELWMVSSWRRDHGDGRWPRAVCGGRKQERILWSTPES